MSNNFPSHGIKDNPSLPIMVIIYTLLCNISIIFKLILNNVGLTPCTRKLITL